MNIIKGASLIQKAITSIAGRGAKLDKDIHTAAVSVLAHAHEHNDATLADRLMHAMPKGSRKLALMEFMLAYGNVSKLDPAQDKQAITDGRLFKMDKTKTFDQVGAEDTPWTEFKKEPDVLTVFDAGAAVAGLMARLKKATNSKLEIQHREEAITQAKALLAALES